MIGPSVFSDRGRSAHAITLLGWVLLVVAALVVVVIGLLILMALLRRRDGEDGIRVDGEREGRRGILIGTGISVLILLGTFVYTLVVLTGYDAGFRDTRLTIRVTGYRYWWALDYLRTDGVRDFTAANEVHIPVGERVRLDLVGGDVIHSFWVPALAGKIDLVPGQTNHMWIEADHPGRYYGQCAEFCGTSHANMRITVFAQSPKAFRAWEAAQRKPAGPGPGGQVLFEARGCAACHTIRGTEAHGDAGPDLTHVGSRSTLAAGIIPNSPPRMKRWLADPDSVKPGTLMPNADLSPRELAVMTSYLESLQ